MKIAYLRDRFPINSTTFIMEDVAGLIRAGHEVQVQASSCELISDGGSGLLVPPSAPLALADRIAALLADRPLRERLGKAARAVVLEHFDGERESGKLATILEDVVAHRSARQQVPRLSTP